VKPRVFLTHTVHQDVLDLLAPHCDLDTNQTPETLPRHEIVRRARSADAMMAFMPDTVDAAFIEQCPRLKVIAAALKGFDNFDVAACTSRGVWLTIVPDLLTVPTAELTIGMAIALTRNIRAADSWVRSGQFQGWRPEFYGLGFANSTIGIVGMGAIGKAIAQRLRGWNATVLYTDRNRVDPTVESQLEIDWHDSDALLVRSEIVILALPLNNDTLHFINGVRLQRMRPDAFLINPCRGSVVDEAAVLAALQARRLGGYAADVFEMEDWARADRPREIAPALLQQPNTVFTAHIGSAVRRVRLEIELRAATNILQVLTGQTPRDAVNVIESGVEETGERGTEAKEDLACSTRYG
jgi:phosphonate dehydrogenase